MRGMSDLKTALQATQLLSQLSPEARAEVFAYFNEVSAIPRPAPPPPRPVAAPAPAPAPVPVRRVRTTGADEVLDAIEKALKRQPEGLKLDGLRGATGYENFDLVRAIRTGLEANRIIKTGEKRATTYFLPGDEPEPEPEPEPAQVGHAGRVIRRTRKA